MCTIFFGTKILHLSFLDLLRYLGLCLEVFHFLYLSFTIVPDLLKPGLSPSHSFRVDIKWGPQLSTCTKLGAAH